MMKKGADGSWPLFCASNEPKSVLARDLGDCRDNHEKLAKRVSYGWNKVVENVATS